MVAGIVLILGLMQRRKDAKRSSIEEIDFRSAKSAIGARGYAGGIVGQQSVRGDRTGVAGVRIEFVQMRRSGGDRLFSRQFFALGFVNLMTGAAEHGAGWIGLERHRCLHTAARAYDRHARPALSRP